MGYGGLRLFLRRHFAQGNLFDHTLPDLGMFHHLAQRSKAFEVEIALVLLGRVATEAILFEQRMYFPFEVRRDGGQRRRNDEYEDLAQRVAGDSVHRAKSRCSIHGRKISVASGGCKDWSCRAVDYSDRPPPLEFRILNESVGGCGAAAIICMVPMEGVEPTHPYGYQILSLARLPIPPHRLPLPARRVIFHV